MSLAHTAFERAASRINDRFELLKTALEEAASKGLFELEVPLDSTYGEPSWWWDAQNQDVIGDFLTKLGVRVKFRNPRIKGTEYPSLHVAWFEIEKVGQLIAEKHNASRAQVEEDGLSISCDNLMIEVIDDLEIDYENSVLENDASIPVVISAIAESARCSLLVASRPGSDFPAQIKLIISNWPSPSIRHLTVSEYVSAVETDLLAKSNHSIKDNVLTIEFLPEAIKAFTSASKQVLSWH